MESKEYPHAPKNNLLEPDNEPKEFELTLSKVLSFIITGFAIVGVLALIWAKWRAMQICATIVFLASILFIVMPDDWD